mgnify:CR=1 FL=1
MSDELLRQRATYLTPHDLRRLDWACKPIAAAFDNTPYLVGSVQTRDDYRDIDIRLILPDAQLEAMTGGSQRLHWLLDAAFTSLLESMCRMPKPIDFQFQSETEAEKETGARNPLGMR